MRAVDGPGKASASCLVMRRKMHKLAKPGPGCKALMEDWAIVLVFVYSFQAIEDSVINLPILSGLKLDSMSGAS